MQIDAAKFARMNAVAQKINSRRRKKGWLEQSRNLFSSYSRIPTIIVDTFEVQRWPSCKIR